MRQYDAETFYDAYGRTVFTLSEGPPAVGLPQRAIKGDTNYTLATATTAKEGIALAKKLATLRALRPHAASWNDTLPYPIKPQIPYHSPLDESTTTPNHRTSHEEPIPRNS